MRLPLGKIAWSTFAFPWMYRGEFARALSLPLLGLLACTMASNTQISAGVASYLVAGLYLLTFTWLAIRCHRLVLTGSHRMDEASSRALGMLGLFAVTVVLLWAVQTVLTLLLTSSVIAALGTRYIEAGAPPSVGGDPEFQALIDRVVFVAQIVALYPVARLSPLFPAVAIGVKWNAAGAWRLTRGNGWRLVLLVFLLPALFESLVDWVQYDDFGAVGFAIAVLLLGAISALGVVALSMSFRELTADFSAPEPPPTPPPS
jgi:hypothetical protein